MVSWRDGRLLHAGTGGAASFSFSCRLGVPSIQAAEAEIMDPIGYICLLALFIFLSAGALIALCACMLSSQISRELDE